MNIICCVAMAPLGAANPVGTRPPGSSMASPQETLDALVKFQARKKKQIPILLTYMAPETLASGVHMEVCQCLPLEEMHLAKKTERLAASAGGLLLFHAKEEDNFTVVNPMLKIRKDLPKLSLQGVTPHIDMVHYGDRYQIVLSRQVDENDGEGSKTGIMVYDSRDESWRHTTSKLPSIANNWYAPSGSTLIFRNMFHCIMDNTAKVMGCFDIARMVWHPQTYTSQLPMVSLSTHKSRMVAATAGKSEDGTRNVVRLNYLDGNEFIDEIVLPEHAEILQVKAYENIFTVVIALSDLPGGPFANVASACVDFMMYDIKTKRTMWPYWKDNKRQELPFRTVVAGRIMFTMFKYIPNFTARP